MTDFRHEQSRHDPHPQLRRRAGPLRSALGPVLLAASAAALVASAYNTRRRAVEAEQANPPRGRFVEAGGVRLHLLERGSGPRTVVLLHGNGATSADFVASGLFDRLARHHRVLAFDRPGYGYSARPRSHLWTPRAQAALIGAALRRLGVERPVVLGHSWGAMVAAALALDAPAEVGGALLLSGYFYPTARIDAALLAPPAIPGIGDAFLYTLAQPIGRHLLLPRLVRRIFAPQPVPRRFSEGFPLELTMRPSQLRASAAEAGMMVPAAAAMAPRYPQIAVPLVIAGGTADRMVGFAHHAARLHGEVPGSELLALPGLGHMAHYFAAPAIAAAVERLAARA